LGIDSRKKKKMQTHHSFKISYATVCKSRT